MKNLVGDDAHTGLQEELDRKLQAKLKETGGKFLRPREYLKEWAYTVDRGGCIPYFFQHYRQNKPADFRVQSPGDILK